MEYDLRTISFDLWLIFYRKQAGLHTDDEFARYACVLDPRKLEQAMEAAADPLLIQSVRYYWCTGMRDRARSRELLQEAADLGNPVARDVLQIRGGRW